MFLNYKSGIFQPSTTGTKSPVLDVYSDQAMGEISISNAMDLVPLLQGSKKSQGQWSQVPIERRRDILSKFLEIFEKRQGELTELISRAEGLSKEHVTKYQTEPSLQSTRDLLAKKPTEKTVRPTGLVSIHAPDVFSFRWSIEKVISALLAGNSVVLTSFSQGAVGAWSLAQLFEQVHVQVGEKDFSKDLLQFLVVDEELLSLIASHPGIRGFCAFLPPTLISKLSNLAASQIKKIQVFAPGNNSILVLSDSEIKKVASVIVSQLQVGNGMTPWSFAKAFVLESQQELFFSEIERQVSEVKLSHSPEETGWAPMRKATLEKAQQTLAAMKAETGRVLVESSFSGDRHLTPLLLKDLSHCSTFQQDVIPAPALLVSPVKYQHEMVKWTNTGYLTLLAQVWGSQEKFEKLSPQLEVGRVYHESWIESRVLPTGWKQSFFGDPDHSPWGSFFSDVRSN